MATVKRGASSGSSDLACDTSRCVSKHGGLTMVTLIEIALDQCKIKRVSSKECTHVHMDLIPGSQRHYC